VASWSI